MADLSIEICGYATAISCGEGEEVHLLNLVNIVQNRADNASKIVGQDRLRQLIFAAIFLADEAEGRVGSVPTAPPSDDKTLSLAKLADRVEAIAVRLTMLAE